MDSNTLLPLINAFYSGIITKAQTPAAKRQAADDFSLMLRTMMLSTISSGNSLGGVGSSSSLFSTNPAGASSNPFQDLLGSAAGLNNSSLPDSLTGMNQSSLGGIFGSDVGTSSFGTQTDDAEINWSSLAGLFNSNMTSLYEKMISNSLSGKAPPAAASRSPLSGFQTAVQAVKGDHVNQFFAEIQAGGDGSNANCGPAALVMALRSLELRVKGETTATTDGEAVDLARRSMVIDPDRDGVNQEGQRVEVEHGTYTTFSDLVRGAQAAGAKADFTSATSNGIRAALQGGAKVIASGTFEDKNPPPWTGDNGWDAGSAPGGATLHIVAVTAYDKASGLFTVQDPARSSSIRVNSSTLDYFMRDNAGALAISRL